MSPSFGSDGNLLPPAAQRAHIKRPLELIKFASWLQARRLSLVHESRRQEPLPLCCLRFVFTEYSSHARVRIMFGFVMTACQRLATACGNAFVPCRTTRRFCECVMDHVTRGHASRVQVRLLRRACCVIPCACVCFSCHCSLARTLCDTVLQKTLSDFQVCRPASQQLHQQHLFVSFLAFRLLLPSSYEANPA